MSDRTPEEREAARRRREARRSGRPVERNLAETPPWVPAPAPAPPTPEPPTPEPPTAEPMPEPPTTAYVPLPSPAAPPRFAVPPPAVPRPVPPPASPRLDDPASPGGPRRGRRPGRPSIRRASGGPRRERGLHAPRSAVPRVVASLALVIAIVAIWFFVELFQPFHGSGHGSVVVTIPAGATTGAIGNRLANDGVISSGFFFGLRTTLAGDRGQLRAGTYRLKRDMGYGAVLSILTTPPPAAKVTNVTVIPGRTRHQIALLLHQQGVHGRYLTSTRHTTVLNVQTYGAPRSLNNLEGFLFPSTYQLREPISIPALVSDQLTTFRQQFATVDMSYARHKNLTPYDVLIIASMIEAEAGTAHDRPLIASVIYNRLRQGMTLGIDATIRYAVNNYTSPLTASQLNSSSPYNTRNHTGLPPTPIDNPGLASIQAAAHPARTSYLFFVAKPCGSGASAFASTDAQFQLDVQRYNNARARRGGRSPLVC